MQKLAKPTIKNLVAPKALIFDMDGTLLDTERLARRHFEDACAEFGWVVESEVYNRCIGSTGKRTENILRGACGPEFPYSAIHQRWWERYHDQVLHQPVDVKHGIIELLDATRALGLPMAVVTSSSRRTVERKLELAELSSYFEFSVCGGETARGKPEPEPYLAAISRMSGTPQQFWALEDSENGVRSALAAGMTVFQIPDELVPTDKVRALGHYVVGNASEVRKKLPAS